MPFSECNARQEARGVFTRTPQGRAGDFDGFVRSFQRLWNTWVEGDQLVVDACLGPATADRMRRVRADDRSGVFEGAEAVIDMWVTLPDGPVASAPVAPPAGGGGEGSGSTGTSAPTSTPGGGAGQGTGGLALAGLALLGFAVWGTKKKPRRRRR